ncbi:hypothetical protein R8Z57_07445 [Microbacterium sp. M3]|uniref:PD-(D/E)XK endonuclease-like domain-containing protein n=1 Tax=Microbacterium arthrosphaerae TaxID=792652 RepID=A0ABU4H1Q9_9MICO|nr:MULTISPECIES: hypothetical protein [Microbacterium]MDW4572609.1 hypothetical protein [Microbacterium arthrosphaerae]MDW7606464.1 hypothetical protein [Microbacterium sp. M3]
MLVALTLEPDHAPLNPAPSLLWRKPQAELAEVVIETAMAGMASGDRTDDFFRAVWILGLLGSSIRSPQSYVHSPVTAAVYESSGVGETLDRLIEVIPQAGLDEVRQLDDIARTELYPHLSPPVHLHPWMGNDFVQAEADIISNGPLLDIKSGRGTANSAGVFGFLPRPQDLYQVLIYALLNRREPKERYGPVTHVGFYFARYGTFLTWPLEELVRELSGRDLDLDGQCQTVIVLADQESYDPLS